ncbi:Predicted P-loop ATPase and inactivated derivatives [Hespellia stercorisuis DSM 15480]|uniref:Predicted P-loop ATPase and inactivated derivatives n=2 Tax=Hespellia stercorisuis TaxID=180311 RepID=A0A1M6VR60_9FIRM|nr:virulence-associated E family protein [Hespellia stercorisuis]SHK83970.1 Predicted P-loop ATPase and inactivated derivatives [Hespellia stercorisuis DSM 15480]
MSKELNEQEKESWEKIGEIMQEEMSSVDDVNQDLARTEKGLVKQSIDNCMIAFRCDPLLKGAIRKNELNGKIDIVKELGWKRKNKSIVDTDVYQIQHYLESTYGLTSEKNINKAMNIIASENGYHPIIQFLEQLKWDGMERMDKLMPKYLGAEDNQYTREIMRLLMIAAIHRIYEPGCKFEIMVCLVGGQGVGKSSFFRLLACMDEWFSDDLKRLDDDNVYRKLQGHWFIEMAEMIATVNARSIEDIKAFISRQKDNYKIPYETHPEDRPRQCVFVGTSNSMDFLPLDRSGNRRFAPILVHTENVEKHILEDEEEAREYILQAWAEAMEWYRSFTDHELKLTKETELYLKELQQQFMPEDTKVGVIQAWLDATTEEYVCSIMIYKEALHHENDEAKQWETREINSIMNESIVGWKPIKSTHRFGNGYGIQRGWKRETDTNGFMQIPEDAKLPFD